MTIPTLAPPDLARFRAEEDAARQAPRHVPPPPPHRPNPDADPALAGFRAALRRHREARRWSQERLALEAEMDHSLLSRWESGHRNPTTAGLAKICAGLRLTREDADHLWLTAGFVPRDMPADELLEMITAWREAGPRQIKAALHLIQEGNIWRHSKENGL